MYNRAPIVINDVFIDTLLFGRKGRNKGINGPKYGN